MTPKIQFKFSDWQHVRKYWIIVYSEEFMEVLSDEFIESDGRRLKMLIRDFVRNYET